MITIAALTNRILIVSLVVFSFALASCEKSTAPVGSSANKDVVQIPTVKTEGTTFGASPNPIVVTDGTGLGVTTLSWSTTKSGLVEIHVNGPAGTLLASGGDSGTADTAKWVTDGMQFYLQDASLPNKTEASATLAVLTVKVIQR